MGSIIFSMVSFINFVDMLSCPELDFGFNLLTTHDTSDGATGPILLILFSLFSSASRKQRSFSNGDSSVVRRRRLSSSVVVVNFSLKILISQKLPDNFFSLLVYSFPRNVPMYCINIDLIESS